MENYWLADDGTYMIGSKTETTLVRGRSYECDIKMLRYNARGVSGAARNATKCDSTY